MRVNCSFLAAVAHRLLSSRPTDPLRPALWVLKDTLGCAPFLEVGPWALLKKHTFWAAGPEGRGVLLNKPLGSCVSLLPAN